MDKMEKKIITIKSDVSAKDKERLSKEGYLPIRVKFHDDIKEHENVQLYCHLNCNACGVRIYMLSETLDAFKRNHDFFACIYGHQNYFPKTTK